MQNPSVCFTGKGKVELLNRPIPSINQQQMLVKTIITQVSIGTEMSILLKDNVYEGSIWETYGTYPFDAGYINIGIVTEVGMGVESTWKGKMVASYGMHAKYTVTTVDECHLVPENLKPEEAIYFVLSEIAMNGVRRARVSWGDNVVVYGAGNIGQLTARYCKMAGAHKIFVVNKSDERLSMVPLEGGFITINNKKENVLEKILKENNGKKADIVFEVTGSADVIPEEAFLLRDNGKLIILSSPRGKTNFDFHDLCNAPSINIIGAHNCSHPSCEEGENPWTKKRNADYFFKLLEQGQLDLTSLKTNVFSYLEAISVYEMLKTKKNNMECIIFKWDIK